MGFLRPAANPSGGDATRFADLYAKALDRLSDPRPPLRVGAMHSLEALGQDHPERRQAIVDVLGAYLRMPPGEDAPVRGTAQRILVAHLRPGGPGFWPGLSLDLTGAALTELDLSGSRIDGSLTLDRATFLGAARLRGIIVGGEACLRGTSFRDHAWFDRADFQSSVHFDASVFQADAWFGSARFGARTSFGAVDFGGHAWFGGCVFNGHVECGQAVFRRSAGFRGAHVPSIGLTGTTFLRPARVSRRGDSWNVNAPGWTVVVDPDNESVGSLLWVGHPELVETTPA